MSVEQTKAELSSGLMPTDEIAVSVLRLARLLGISVRHVRRMEAESLLGPRPIRLGRCVRYRVSEIEEWVAAGAPNRARWDCLKQGVEGS